MKKRTKRGVVISIVVIALAGVVIALSVGGKKDVVLQTVTVSKGTVETTVMATGYVQPVEEVEVGTQVSGVIEKIYVDYNSHVKKGQLLAQLETNTLNEKVNQAKASLKAANSDLNYARQSYERINKLYEDGAATLVSFEEAVNRLNQAETTLVNAEAALRQAEVDLTYAYIYSPIDGVVLDRAVNIGQTVAASFSTPTLFTIAEDLTKMQVEADVDEADIGQVRVGQYVSFTVDAYPDDVFAGTVSQIRLQPVVTSNVVTYTVIVDAPNPVEKLYPGMTASITITTESEKGLLVPVEAINFNLSEKLADNLLLPGTSSDNSLGVWVMSGSYMVRRQIVSGLSDGVHCIVRNGLSEGQEVVLSAVLAKKQPGKKSKSIMPEPPKGMGSGGPGGHPRAMWEN